MALQGLQATAKRASTTGSDPYMLETLGYSTPKTSEYVPPYLATSIYPYR